MKTDEYKPRPEAFHKQALSKGYWYRMPIGHKFINAESYK